MSKFKNLLFICLILSFLVFSTTLCFGDDHSLPYQIYFINDYYTGMLFLTAKVDTVAKTLEIEYEPNEINRVKTIEISIGNVQNDFKDIKILNSFVIENRELKAKETTLKQIFKFNNFTNNMKLVLWVNKVNPSNDEFQTLDKKTILERVQAIIWEQLRLGDIRTYKGKDELFSEISRNYEE